MKEIVEYLLKLMIDFPDRLIITEIVQENVTILEISADPADIGKIIGKQGRFIKALRSIVNAATIKAKNRVIIRIEDTKNKIFPLIENE